MTSGNRALWYVGGGRVELREAATPAASPGDVVVRAAYSALSRGTERLVLNGRVPASEHQRMRCPRQEGEFPYPVKYGYAVAGTVTAGDAARVGQRVFALHPHQDMFMVPGCDAHAIPESVPLRRATLAANAETALNVIWDAHVGPGDRVLVVGGGVLGLLIARLAIRIPGTLVTVCDTEPTRSAVVGELGAHFARPGSAPGDQDIVIHTSASEAGLALALASAGVEARVVEASWYGDRTPAIPLGEAFHARRLQLISSQVGSVPADRRARWPNARRLDAALQLLRDDALDALITAEYRFTDAPARVPAALADGAPGLCAVLDYEGNASE
jgi:2-desacetyl-2-hydroxyethyl bacteriochlorophyllide A dehydrogenase